MKLCEASQDNILHSLKKVVQRYTTGEEPGIVTDIHIQPKQDSGELFIFNDDDEQLAHTLVEEWVDYNNDDFYDLVENLLRGYLVNMRNNGDFDRLALMKPYSFVLVDDEKETIAELMLVDDDTLVLGDDLLKGLDQELDDFLEKLLKE